MRSLLLLLLISQISWRSAGQSLSSGTGTFLFSGNGLLREKPIRVFYHIPVGQPDSMPVLMAFHGDERDAQAYVNDWISVANQNRFMVFAPEFSEASFPGGDGYNLANIFVDGDNPSPQTLNPDSVWTFSILDPLFLDIKSRTNNISESYVAFGHSAGAQFLSRFLLFKPENRMQLAIGANAGWYTVPNGEVSFPYGLRQSPATEMTIKRAFAKNFLVLLGKLDTNPSSPGLRHTPQADAQGLFRLARGRYFFSESQKIAESQNMPFRWQLSEVEGVGHDHSLMAKAAVGAVLTAFGKPIPGFAEPKNPEISWSSEGIRISALEEGESFKIHAYNLGGQSIWSTEGIYQSTKTIYWKPDVKGIYILQLTPEKSKSTTIKVLINQ